MSPPSTWANRASGDVAPTSTPPVASSSAPPCRQLRVARCTANVPLKLGGLEWREEEGGGCSRGHACLALRLVNGERDDDKVTLTVAEHNA